MKIDEGKILRTHLAVLLVHTQWYGRAKTDTGVPTATGVAWIQLPVNYNYGYGDTHGHTTLTFLLRIPYIFCI